jgi:hypothetical protein
MEMTNVKLPTKKDQMLMKIMASARQAQIGPPPSAPQGVPPGPPMQQPKPLPGLQAFPRAYAAGGIPR